MQTNLSWQKGIFKSTYRIFSGKEQIGSLHQGGLSSKAVGQINGKKYLFKSPGFFAREILIIDPGSDKTLGKIIFSSWKTRADIRLGNEAWKWEYDNAWGNRWSLAGPEGVRMQFRGAGEKGSIDTGGQDGLLVLTGLYLTNYYWQMFFLVFIAIIIPIIIIL